MKRLIASLVAVVFLVGFTFAQNTSTVTQSSSTNNANVTQMVVIKQVLYYKMVAIAIKLQLTNFLIIQAHKHPM